MTKISTKKRNAAFGTTSANTKALRAGQPLTGRTAAPTRSSQSEPALCTAAGPRDVRAALDRSSTVAFAEVRTLRRRAIESAEAPFICG